MSDRFYKQKHRSCIDCRHLKFGNHRSQDRCNSPRIAGHHGGAKDLTPSEVRNTPIHAYPVKLCGVEGDWFEPRDNENQSRELTNREDIKAMKSLMAKLSNRVAAIESKKQPCRLSSLSIGDRFKFHSGHWHELRVADKLVGPEGSGPIWTVESKDSEKTWISRRNDKKDYWAFAELNWVERVDDE